MASGGNAVDGAVAANAVQGVVAPETCGVGGDLFALVHTPGQDIPTVLNASGRAGGRADARALRTAGYATVPFTHPDAVTVPGCVEGWSELIERFGRLPLERVLDPAIRCAVDGFEVSAELARSLQRLRETSTDPPPDAALFPEWRSPRTGCFDRPTRTGRHPGVNRLGGTRCLLSGEGRAGDHQSHRRADHRGRFGSNAKRLGSTAQTRGVRKDRVDGTAQLSGLSDPGNGLVV